MITPDLRRLLNEFRRHDDVLAAARGQVDLAKTLGLDDSLEPMRSALKSATMSESVFGDFTEAVLKSIQNSELSAISRVFEQHFAGTVPSATLELMESSKIFQREVQALSVYSNNALFVGLPEMLSEHSRNFEIFKELIHWYESGQWHSSYSTDTIDGLISSDPTEKDSSDSKNEDQSIPKLAMNVIFEPAGRVEGGILLRSVCDAWYGIAEAVVSDWSKVHEIPPEKWEEMIAGAFKRQNYDEVILTPRSRDFGRDVIAIKRGLGSIKIIGSVKAYSAGNLVSYDDVRALAGELSAEQSASKGMLITTSRFPPRIHEDELLIRLMPHRLELVDGQMLRSWLSKLIV